MTYHSVVMTTCTITMKKRDNNWFTWKKSQISDIMKKMSVFCNSYKILIDTNVDLGECFKQNNT